MPITIKRTLIGADNVITITEVVVPDDALEAICLWLEDRADRVNPERFGSFGELCAGSTLRAAADSLRKGEAP